MNENVAIELVKPLIGGGPLGVAVYFLGKEVLKAWQEDRKQLQTTNLEVLTFLRSLAPVIAGLGPLMTKVLDRLDEMDK